MYTCIYTRISAYTHPHTYINLYITYTHTYIHVLYVYKSIFVKQILGAAFNAFWVLRSTRRGGNKAKITRKKQKKYQELHTTAIPSFVFKKKCCYIFVTMIISLSPSHSSPVPDC